jgi:hypothetical protein
MEDDGGRRRSVSIGGREVEEKESSSHLGFCFFSAIAAFKKLFDAFIGNYLVHS